jgi:tetratricopeptide (TPR) repeat protein
MAVREAVVVVGVEQYHVPLPRTPTAGGALGVVLREADLPEQPGGEAVLAGLGAPGDRVGAAAAKSSMRVHGVDGSCDACGGYEEVGAGLGEAHLDGALAGWDFPLDEGWLMQGWAPMPFFPTNLPEFPPALRREGRSIIISFYDPTDHFEAARHYDRSLAHFEIGEYDEAVEALDASLELMPDRVAALYYKGTALAKLGRHGEALKVYDAALELNPGDAEILFNKGIALDELGRPDDAIAAYDEALATEPDHAGALTNKGAILAEQGKNEAALRRSAQHSR